MFQNLDEKHPISHGDLPNSFIKTGADAGCELNGAAGPAHCPTV